MTAYHRTVETKPEEVADLLRRYSSDQNKTTRQALFRGIRSAVLFNSSIYPDAINKNPIVIDDPTFKPYRSAIVDEINKVVLAVLGPDIARRVRFLPRSTKK